MNKQASALTMQQLDATLINAFLDDLEKCRNVSTGSRNLRFVRFAPFCRFAVLLEPDHSDRLEQIIAIPSKECVRHEK